MPLDHLQRESTCYAVELRITRTERSKEGFELSRAIFAGSMQEALAMMMAEATKTAQCMENGDQ